MVDGADDGEVDDVEQRHLVEHDEGDPGDLLAILFADAAELPLP